MQFSLNIQTIANVTLILNGSSTKKVILNEQFKCSLHFKNNIVCYILQRNNNSFNEIRNRTGVRLQATFRGVSLVKESAALNDSESQ